MERHAKEYTNSLFVECKMIIINYFFFKKKLIFIIYIFFLAADLGTLLEYENYLKESSAEREGFHSWLKFISILLSKINK